MSDEITDQEKHIPAKKSRKIKKVTLIVFFVIFILVVLSASLALLKLKYLLGDDLIVYLTPDNAEYNIEYNQAAKLDFLFSTNNNNLCSTYCEYNFYDVSLGKSIDHGNFTIGAKENKAFSYNVSVLKSKEGQSIYTFKTQCSNIKEHLCFSSQIVRQDSSFVVLNYRLTEYERDIKPKIKENLQTYLSKLQNLEREMYELQEISKHQLISNDLQINSQDKNNNIKSKFEALNDEYLDLIGIWNDENYFYLSTYFSLIGYEEEYELDTEIENFRKTISSQVNLFNQQSEEIKKLDSKFENVSKFARIPFANKPRFEKEFRNLKSKYNDYLALHNDYSIINSNDILTLDADLNKINNNIIKDIVSTGSLIDNTILEINSAICDVENKSCDNRISSKSDINSKCDDYIKLIERVRKDYSNNITLSRTQSNLEKTCEDKTFIELKTSNLSIIEINQSELYTVDYSNYTSLINITIQENLEQCCVFGKCESCCIDCSDDNYPIIFIHGHSSNDETVPEFSLYAFDKLQNKLESNGFISAGNIKPNQEIKNYEKGIWGKSGHPITLKATYYYDYYSNRGSYFIVSQKSENIETYSIRLKEIIDDVKYISGKDKVIIVAHSMGGLVSRKYLQIFGEDSVDKLILIATPNKGVIGNVNSLCGVFGNQNECKDMQNDSIFMAKLNDQRKIPTKTKVYMIYGTGCDTQGFDGDGIVTVGNAKLDFAKNYEISGNCTSFFSPLHTDLLDINKYPQVYDIVKNILEENESKNDENESTLDNAKGSD